MTIALKGLGVAAPEERTRGAADDGLWVILLSAERGAVTTGGGKFGT
jgi:hypothetical protein